MTNATDTGLKLVGQAFKRALVSQAHPKMLGALFMPVLIAIVGAIVLVQLFWAPLGRWLNEYLSHFGFVEQIDQWLIAIGFISVKMYMIPVLVAGILLPMAGVLGVVIAAIFVMPIVLRHIEKRQYPELGRMGKNVASLGVWNAIKVSVVFAIGWVVTMPLWLFPPMALFLPLFWWSFLFSRIMRVDALIEHASPSERKILWKRHNVSYWLMGFAMALLNTLPPMWLVLPVFSALVYAHFSLQALQYYRQQQNLQLAESVLT